MAKPDHTALARPSNHPDGKVIPRANRPPRSADIDELAQQRRRKAAEIGVAVYALTRMLPDRDARLLALVNEVLPKRRRKPLGELYSEGLKAAIHYLTEYARTLDPKPRVKR